MSDGWVKTDRGWRKVYSAAPDPVAASDFPCPRVISDVMPETAHVDGKHYTSKSAFRAVTKREGYVEVGNDPARLKPVTPVKSTKAERSNAVRKAVAQTLGT